MRTIPFDVMKGMAHKVPLTKLVLIDSDLHPYLAALLVAALYEARDAIIVPSKRNVILFTKKRFENFLANEEAKIYKNYGTVAWNCHFYVLSKEPEY